MANVVSSSKQEAYTNIIIPNEVAFIIACEKGYLELATDCINKGVDPQVQNNAALVAACRNGHLEVVRLLIECGANIYAQGALPFFEAVRNNRIPVINYLLKMDNNYRKLYTRINFAKISESEL